MPYTLCPSSGASRLSELQDAYHDTKNPRPELTFLLEDIGEAARVKGEPRVVNRSEDAVLPPSQYFRIGSVESAYDAEANRRKAKKGKKTVPAEHRYTKTMTTYFWKCTSDPSEAPLLVEMPTWRPRKHPIYDIDCEVQVEADTAVPDGFEPDKRYRYDDDEAEEMLFLDFQADFIKRRNAASELPYDFSRRSSLRYVFWDLVAEDENMGVPKFPKSGVPVALRFVNHLGIMGQGGYAFSTVEELDLTGADTYKRIHQGVVENLKVEHGDLWGDMVKLKYELGVDWDMELWVLPQRMRSLFKLKEGRNICDFLDPELVEKQDSRLFMEVHLVPLVHLG